MLRRLKKKELRRLRRDVYRLTVCRFIGFLTVRFDQETEVYFHLSALLLL